MFPPFSSGRVWFYTSARRQARGLQPVVSELRPDSAPAARGSAQAFGSPPALDALVPRARRLKKERFSSVDIAGHSAAAEAKRLSGEEWLVFGERKQRPAAIRRFIRSD
jgi:hypothetical protein